MMLVWREQVDERTTKVPREKKMNEIVGEKPSEVND
jgi:hypothetical protein